MVPVSREGKDDWQFVKRGELNIVSNRRSPLRNLVALVLLLLAVAGSMHYPERAPSSDPTPVPVGTVDETILLPPAPTGAGEDTLPLATEVPGFGGTSPVPGNHTHVVTRGETLSQLALLYQVQVATLASYNGLSNPDMIRVGQRLVIPGGDGVLHTVAAGDSIWVLSRHYGVSEAAIIEANGLRNPSLLRMGQTLVIPGGKATPITAGSVELIWPVIGGRISSVFGPRGGRLHTGIDIAAPTGTPIRAAAAGIVVTAGWLGGYGRTVMIRHANGMVTLYAHASELLVRKGQDVTQGQIVARVGSSGNSTGPHLHFETIVAGRPRDPMLYLSSRQ